MSDDDIVDAELVEDDMALVPVGVETGLEHDSGAVSPLRQLREGLALLDQRRIELEAAGDHENLSYGVADVAQVIGDLQTLNRDARMGIARILDGRWLADGTMTTRPDGTYSRKPHVDLANLGRVKVEGGNTERKNWDSEKLLNKLILDCIVDAAGEVIEYETPTHLAYAIRDKIVACVPITPSLGWRVGQKDEITGLWSGLRGAGIDPSDYCDEVVKDRIANVPKRTEGD